MSTGQVTMVARLLGLPRYAPLNVVIKVDETRDECENVRVNMFAPDPRVFERPAVDCDHSHLLTPTLARKHKYNYTT